MWAVRQIFRSQLQRWPSRSICSAPGPKTEQNHQPHDVSTHHVPVLFQETLSALNIRPEEIFIDLTFGTGVHSKAILERGGRVIAIDMDPSVEDIADSLKEDFNDAFTFRVAKFTDIREILSELNVRAGSVAGVVAECGCSTIQLNGGRGFSMAELDAKLDMRMDSTDSDTPTAARLVNTLSANSLARILKTYGEEKHARRIAEAIIAYRYEMQTINTVGELCQVVENAFLDETLGNEEVTVRSNKAAKTLQALRIFVNDELNQLNRGLGLMHDVLRKDGVAAVISLHPLEDRIVKRHFFDIDMEEPTSHSISQKYRNAAGWHKPEDLPQKWKPLFGGPVMATKEEIETNPAMKNAKLRAAKKLLI